ncbi:MAG: GtrA family protein [Methylocystis sp.]
MTLLSDVRLSILDRSRHAGLGRIAVDLFKYGVASVGALALDAGTMVFLNKVLGINYLVAAAIGFTCGLGLVYWLSVSYVFGHSRRLRPSQEMLGFVATGLIGLLLNEFLMKTFVEQVGLSVVIAKVPTAGVVFLFNFTARRALLFSDVAKMRVASLVAAVSDPSRMKARVAEWPLWGTVALATLAAVGLTFSQARDVWSIGRFFDTDDAMRAVQVRDLLAGQAWFDMTTWRYDPPAGVFSHWSRVIDVPLAALYLLFGVFLDAEHAERATRLVFPLALLVTLFSLSPWLTRILAPTANRHVAVLLAFLSGAVFLQFVPGRIDHHAPQIVLLLTALGLFLRGLEKDRARAMAPACVAMALSVAISLENLPFFAVMLAGLGMLFVVDGAKMRASMGWFAASALIAFPACFVATVGPTRYFLSTCDAYSTVHLMALVIGALGFAALALLTGRLQTTFARAAAVGAAGVAVIAPVLIVAPKCVGDPLGGLDPLLRELWLAHVTEARPLLSFWSGTPNLVVVMGLPVILGFVAALVEAARAEKLARRRWFLVAGVIAIGFAAGMWQVRVFSSVTPIAMAPLVVAVIAISRRIGSGFSAFTRALLAGVLCIGVSPMGLASVLPKHDRDSAVASASRPTEEALCLMPAALEPLKHISPARIIGSINLGPYLLAQTHHSVFAGPYHRDNHGNRIVVDTFLAPPDEAERIARAAGAEIVLWCGRDVSEFAERSPNGLGAALARGEVPEWLEPLPESKKQLLVFAVRPKQ